MTTTTQQAGSRIIPTMRYQDAPGAIEWLCKVLGFERHLVVPGEADGQVDHAQLTFGPQMIMLGTEESGREPWPEQKVSQFFETSITC